MKLMGTVCDRRNCNGSDWLKLWIKQFSGVCGRFRMASEILD